MNGVIDIVEVIGWKNSFHFHHLSYILYMYSFLRRQKAWRQRENTQMLKFGIDIGTEEYIIWKYFECKQGVDVIVIVTEDWGTSKWHIDYNMKMKKRRHMRKLKLSFYIK